MSAAIAGVGHMTEITVSIRVVQGAMFPKVFDIISALDLVEHFVIKVGPGQNLAAFIEIQAPGIAPALGEQLKCFGPRVIAPNALLKLEVANVGGDRAALRAVKPTVRSPS